MIIWQPRCTNPTTLLDLTVDARRVLGVLSACRKMPATKIAMAVFLDYRQTELIITEIYTCPHWAVKHAVRLGLPMEYAVSLHGGKNPLRCRRCGVAMSLVPCVSCDETIEDLKYDEGEFECYNDKPESGMPVLYQPGTSEKVAAMRQRASAGFGVFCRGDAEENIATGSPQWPHNLMDLPEPWDIRMEIPDFHSIISRPAKYASSGSAAQSKPAMRR